MRDILATLVFLTGVAQLGELFAAAQVPIQLEWKTQLNVLPRLHRQMYWVYGGYVVLAIVAFGLLSVFNAREMANGTTLSPCLCGYMAIFWGVRLGLQGVLDVKPYLRTWWLKLGYHALTLLFVCFTCLYGYAALQPR
jgi:hypothetical protein